MKTTLAPIILIALFLGCESSRKPEAAPSASASPPASASAILIAARPVPESVEPTRLPLAPAGPGELEEVAKGTNAFAFDLLGRMNQRKGNLAFSPLGIFTALTMASGGASSETAAEMKSVLHLAKDPEKSMEGTGKLALALSANGSNAKVRIVNRLFGDGSYAFDPSYQDSLRRAFGAPIESVDFKGDFDKTRSHINELIDRQTENRIRDFLPAGSVDGSTRLLLANAIYFRAEWAEPFDKGETTLAPFRASPSDAHPVPTMQATRHGSFAALDQLKVLEIRYAGDDWAMTFVLPDATFGLEALEKKANRATFEGWIGALKPAEINVSLPKLDIDAADPISLAPELTALGMRTAFDPERADFKRIAKAELPGDRLYLSRVLHKAFVKVDEQGTEAAAATAVTAAAGAAPPSEPAKVFHADHPFLFFLRDTRTKTILFVGRVNDPASKS